MTASRWNQLRTLLDEALALPPDQREIYLRTRCAHDPALLDEVRLLLEAYEESGSMPSGSAAENAATRLDIPQHEDPLIGRETDGYRILKVLGRGGMGVVYKALNKTLNRIEALKVITPAWVENEELLRRFKVEAQALARIHHSNIVTIYTLRQSDIGAYITMEYVEGRTLADVLNTEGAIAWQQAVPMFTQLLDAFDYAHRRGIIHRDVKPRNIMLMGDGTVKVMDFGLARFYQEHDVTRTAGVIGTPCYMSPEQITGVPLDQRTDLFSLGLTMYEVLTGDLPFDRNASQFSIHRAIIEERFPSPAHIERSIPGEVAQTVEKALEKDLDRRYQQASEMLADLRVVEGGLSTLPIRGGRESTERPERSKSLVDRLTTRGGLVVLGIVLIVGLGWALATQGPALFGLIGVETDPNAGEEPATEGLQDLTATPFPFDELPGLDAENDGAPEMEEPPPVEEESLPEEDTGEEIPPPETPEEDADEGLLEERGEEAPEPFEEPQQMEDGEEEEIAEEEATAEDAAEEEIVEEEIEEAPEPDAAPGPSAAELAVQEARDLRRTLADAIMDDSWQAVPEPAAEFYQDQLSGLSRHFNITNVGIEIDDLDMRTVGGRTTLPITVRVDYRQGGRDGIRSLPIPAVWIWAEDGGEVTLISVIVQ